MSAGAKEIGLGLAEDIGFTIACIKSFMSPEGVSSETVKEALERLEDSHVSLCMFLDTLPGDGK